MKKIINSIIFVILLIVYTNATAQQSIEISFAANYYEQPVNIDSILIKNINRNCDTMLYAPDTTLMLYYTVGLNENQNINNNFSVSQNYPNPVINNSTSINVTVPKNELLELRLFDINGNFVAAYNNKLKTGQHTFNILVAKSGIYVLTAIFNNQKQSIKIISQGSNNKHSASIIHATFKEALPLQKVVLANNEFYFEPGDTLWYVGYAKTPYMIDGSDVLESAPKTDTLINFIIIEGIPCNGIEAVKHGGYLYPTVQIDNKCWLKENMNIGIMVHGDTNMTNNNIIEKYCYDNKTENCDVYGGLYQWDELMEYSTQVGAQGICPNGWHISTLNEWDSLIVARSANELKEKGTTHWLPGNNANNSSGLTALPAGYKNATSGSFEMIYEGNGFFSSKEYDVDTLMAWDKTMYYASSWILGGPKWKTTGKSVRCIMD